MDILFWITGTRKGKLWISKRSLFNICWDFRERCRGNKPYFCFQVSLRQILAFLIPWTQKTADPELTAYVSGFEEEIMTDMVMDWLDIQSSTFSLQSTSTHTVSLNSSFVREPAKMRKLGLREGKWLAKYHTACKCRSTSSCLLWRGYFLLHRVSVFVAKVMARDCPGPISWGRLSLAPIIGNLTRTGLR